MEDTDEVRCEDAEAKVPLLLLPQEVVPLPFTFLSISAPSYLTNNSFKWIGNGKRTEIDVLLGWKRDEGREGPGTGPLKSPMDCRSIALGAQICEIRRGAEDQWNLALKCTNRLKILDLSYDKEADVHFALYGKLESDYKEHRHTEKKSRSSKSLESLKMELVNELISIFNAMPTAVRNASFTSQTIQILKVGQYVEIVGQEALCDPGLYFMQRSPPGTSCDIVGSVLTKSDPTLRRKLLETINVRTRLHLVLDLLKSRVNMISSSLSSKESKAQSKLQEKSHLDIVIERLSNASPPDEVFEIARREIERLKRTPDHHPGYSSALTYLETLADLPWTRNSEIFDVNLAKVEAHLNKDHAGLKDVKRRILEFVAVQLLKGQQSNAPVLCLVGPPGVGKTSIAKSIAEALGKRFQRISLGGVRDEAEIRGHRRTYIGAMPGRVINAIKQAKAMDPVLLLDEVDKTGQDSRGDPAAALLELLDPEQNKAFLDHYLGVPYDMSNVTFIATANNVDHLPRPLLDRMEIIFLAGYTVREKIAIAQKHLIPSIIEKNGLSVGNLEFSDDSIRFLIENYTREAGVREMQRHIDSICRHTAVKLVSSPIFSDSSVGCTAKAESQRLEQENRSSEKSLDISESGVGKSDENIPLQALVPGTAKSKGSGPSAGPKPSHHTKQFLPDFKILVNDSLIEDILGPIKFDQSDNEYRVSTPGAAAGLVWTAHGGKVQYIECARVNPVQENIVNELGNVPERSGSLKLTGLMGEMLNESAHIALSWVRANCPLIIGLDQKDAHEANIHIHLPSGAVQKDGPSAGITLAVAIVSLLTAQSVRADTALTGEISLRGLVLPVGGIKEKVIAAHTTGLKRVILPARNFSEAKLAVQDEDIEGEIEIIPVNTLEEVLAAAFSPPILLNHPHASYVSKI